MSILHTSFRRRAAAGALSVVSGTALACSPTTSASAAATTIYVSPMAAAGAPGTSCATAAYSTIDSALAKASPGDTVVACAGTYREDVVVRVPFLSLVGESATIDAAGLPGNATGAVVGQDLYNGITIEASRVTVEGFTVEGAQGEGILAVNPNPVKGPVIAKMQLFTGQPLTHVTIEDNLVTGNDQGFSKATSPYRECTPKGGSDCGEGIHLMSVAYSQVIDNRSVGNAGGILVTDEFGPSDNNLIEGNYVEGNTKDCGITLPGHNLALNPRTGKLDPSFGGVYANRVVDNEVIANGVKGYGAGIGIFAPESFTASYGNLVSGNLIEGNGLAGISVHSHQANAYVNGNAFVGNTIGENNVDRADGTDTKPIDHETTGILIWSAATMYHFTVKGNRILADTYGIWLTPSTVSVTGLSTNYFSTVTTQVYDAK
ncbi:MAG TPA: NosD domain-containing protein [Acidimicrobiales bacterium]|nr:NosD domain-containing protein [Acidimicrobiales bacterium]